MGHHVSVLATLVLLAAAPHAETADPCQTTQASGTFAEVAVPGADSTIVSGINNRGQIVGTYSAGGVTSGFVLDGDDYTELNIPGSTITRVTDINSHGVIVGSYRDSSGEHGFIWDDGSITTLDMPGVIATSPNGINDAGTVVGMVLTPGNIDGIDHGFIYRDGEFQMLDYPNAGGTVLNDINNAGSALGNYANPTPAYFLYNSGTFTAVSVCPPYTVVQEITNQGDLIGSTQTGVNTTMGAVTTRRGLLLVSPPDASQSSLVAGNAAGVLVGLYQDLSNHERSFVFVPH